MAVEGVVLDTAVALWLTIELGLQLRDRLRPRAPDRDRGTAHWLAVTIGLGVALGAIVGHRHPGAGGRVLLVVAAGLVTAGAALRLWAVATLGRQFRVTVTADETSTLVTHGPFRRIRHPSYAGLLVCLAGVGVADGSAWSVLVLTLVPLPAFIHRIRVEEAVLTSTFGASYLDYEHRTRRLLPHLW